MKNLLKSSGCQFSAHYGDPYVTVYFDIRQRSRACDWSYFCSYSKVCFTSLSFKIHTFFQFTTFSTPSDFNYMLTLGGNRPMKPYILQILNGKVGGRPKIFDKSKQSRHFQYLQILTIRRFWEVTDL